MVLFISFVLGVTELTSADTKVIDSKIMHTVIAVEIVNFFIGFSKTQSINLKMLG